jgi:hypothetical protein
MKARQYHCIKQRYVKTIVHLNCTDHVLGVAILKLHAGLCILLKGAKVKLLSDDYRNSITNDLQMCFLITY